MAEKTCLYCGAGLGDCRPTTKYHAYCRIDAKRMGML